MGYYIALFRNGNLTAMTKLRERMTSSRTRARMARKRQIKFKRDGRRKGEGGTRTTTARGSSSRDAPAARD